MQRRLAGRVVTRGPAPRPLRLVAGVDCSIARDGRLTAAGVACRLPDFAVAATSYVTAIPPMPYVPGLLSFREAPIVLEALANLDADPQAVLVDGHGLAHPRRLGIAAHLGLFIPVPTVGVAKSILVGEHAPLAEERGARAPLLHGGERIGMALRTRTGVKPVYVSVGGHIGLLPAVRLVLRTGGGYRLPEPVRQADRLSRRRAHARP